MGAGATIRTAVALALAVAAAAAARAQTPSVSIEDARVVEGSSGDWTLDVRVNLSASTPSAVSVSWTAVSGSATSGVDFIPAAGPNPLTFPPYSTTLTFPVTIRGDAMAEWSLTLQFDEVFFFELTNPTNATLLKRRSTVTIVDDDRPYSGLQLVSAVADSSGGSGRVRLQWRVPPAPALSGPVTDVLVRWNEGPSCSAPATASDTVNGGEFPISAPPLPTLPATVNPAGEPQVFEHLGRPFVRHCYALFAVYATPATERATVVATPFDSANPSLPAWAYSVGGSLPDVVPPTVGLDAVYTVSTDGVVHAMTRGAAGGAWPASWNPVALGKPAHNRSPVVPLPYGARLFVGTESGEVHAVDGVTGAIAWSRSYTSAFPGVGVQGTPAGLFTSFAGGQNDVILVGTNSTGSNTFYMLDPVTGANVATLSNGAMGAVRGMPVVDYPGNRAFFVTTLPSGALWAFDLGPPGSPWLTPSTLPAGNPLPLAYGSNWSPVLSNGRIYFGTTNGDVVAYRPASGQVRSLGGLADGEVKGFVFPDRRNNSFYFSTGSRVWGIADTGSTDPLLTLQWWVDDIPNPSVVLHWTNTNYLYVGGADGRLYEIDVSASDRQSTKKSVLLEPGVQIGAPSLDGPNGLVHVGSATGVVYAVRVPLP